MENEHNLLEAYLAIPKITRYYTTLVVILAFLAHFDYISTLQLYYNYRLVFIKHQIWRLLTNFLYFGPINFDFLFHMFFLLRYFRILEEESFHNKPADFMFMLLFGGCLMLMIGSVLHIPFLSTALTFMIVYVWARRNPFVLMNFLGLFNFTAPYMPWVLLGFSFVLSGNVPSADIIGIVVGHLYYFLTNVYPASYGRRILKTPKLLLLLFNQVEESEGSENNREVQQEGQGESEYLDANEDSLHED